MIKTIRIILAVLLVLYASILLDAYVFGFTKQEEKIVQSGYIPSRWKHSAARYWVITNKSKINIDQDLYGVLQSDSTMQVYRSKIWRNVIEVEYKFDGVPLSYNICTTRTSSGLALNFVFILLTILAFFLINRGTYKGGKIGLTVFLVILFAISLICHLYA